MAQHALIELRTALTRPEPWAEGDNIPWHEPTFSRRMLKEHLDQSHDRASRRLYIVDRHVGWLDKFVLKGPAQRILDLGCGPGLYCHRLAALGHTCVGIDYSPASVKFARAEAQQQGLSCRFIQGDLRTTPFENGYALAMLLYGELNVFRPTHARAILQKAHAALDAHAKLVIEAHTAAAVQRLGQQEATWYVADAGLFGDSPYACLTQRFWTEEDQTATIRHFVIDLADGSLTRYAQTLQGYTQSEYHALLTQIGFDPIEALPGFTENPQEADPDFVVLVAEKAPTA
jgi:SAM-dependent methyltransferase